MANINEKLQTILDSKKAINAALIEKGVDMTGVPFSGYAEKITAIPVGLIESFDGEKEYDNFTTAEELEYMNIKGALLWTKNGVTEGTEGYLCATNGNSTASGYWDPTSTTITTPSKDGYTLIGVCLGNGYWVRVGYAGLTTTKYWCQSSDAAYQYLEGACYHSGYEITNYMINAANYSTDSIWGLRDADSLATHIYIPNWAELIQVCNLACDGGAHTSGHTFDNNLGKLIGLSTSDYWSASQYPNSGYYFSAFSVYFDDGYSYYLDKDYDEYKSIALLHFGA